MDSNSIFDFFPFTNQFKKYNEIHVGFLEDVILFVIKSNFPMKIVESIWLQKMAYKLCPIRFFLINKYLWLMCFMD